MLDKRTALVLMSINKMCSNGSFQVIEVEDLIASMPKKYMADINLITQSINALERNGYIEVKYHDKNVFCLCPLPKGRFEFENIVEGVEKKKKIYLWAGVISFGVVVLLILCSFLGALLFDAIRG